MGEHGGDEKIGITDKGIMQNVLGLGSGGAGNFSVSVCGLDSNNKDNLNI